MTGQPQFLPEAMPGMPPRAAYPREMYPPPPPPSAAFIRDRILSSYAVQDPRVGILIIDSMVIKKQKCCSNIVS